MSDSSIERAGILLKVHDNLDGTFSLYTYQDGGAPLNVRTVTANVALDNTYDVILCNGGALIVLLPPATGVVSKTTIPGFYIKKIDATSTGTVAVTTSSSQTVDGDSTGWELPDQFQYVLVLTDGSNWYVFGGN